MHGDAPQLNLVGRCFRELTDKATRRGALHSAPDPIEAIEQFLDAHDDDPRPFVRTASAEAIIEKVNRCNAV